MTVAGRPSSEDTQLPDSGRREVVLGKNSKVWRGLAADARIAARVGVAIGHSELSGFAFTANDRVWVFSYSRDENENAALLQRLGQAGVAEVVYVSSSSCRVASRTTCYEYPRVKQQAETQALALGAGKVLTIGLVYAEESELPAGDNVATSLAELGTFMLAPAWPDGQGRRKHLFRQVSRPFSGPLERVLYRGYGWAILSLKAYPCALRPIDLLLRTLRMRWYGYVYLSNRLWISTTS
jgi:hypothetical protein